MKQHLRLIFNIALFFVGIWLVISNRRPVGVAPLGKMILGLVCLLVLLYRYNKRYT